MGMSIVGHLSTQSAIRKCYTAKRFHTTFREWDIDTLVVLFGKLKAIKDQIKGDTKECLTSPSET